jgi:hypothetical protein
MIRFGACECCAVLKEEVSFLRSLVRPKPSPHNPLPIVTFEADQVIGGGDHQTEFQWTPEEEQRQAEIDSEAARILSANY